MIEEVDSPSPLGPSARPLLGLATLVARLCFGLGAGLLGLEAYHWGRFGVAGGPLLADVLREGGWRLPRTSWVGLERVLEWSLSQSVFVLAGVCCLAVAWMTRRGKRRLRALPAERPETLPSIGAAEPIRPVTEALPTTVRILQAYSAMDRKTSGPVATPAQPDPPH